MIVKIKTLNPRGLWVFPIAAVATFFFYILYAGYSWWMFFCCLFAYLIQCVCAGFCAIVNDEKKINSTSSDYEAQLNQYAAIGKRYKKIFVLGYIVMILFDLFPFLSMNESFCATLRLPVYEGGLLVFLMVIIVIGAWSAALFDVLQVDVKKDYQKEYTRLSKEEHKRLCQIERRENELKQIKANYGEKAIVIDVAFSKIIISEEMRVVRLFDADYKFDDILGCSLVDDATSETITTSIGKAKTSTGNMVGRAIVGGVLTGGLGAVAGAATAKKNISTDATSLTTTTHKYTIYVNVDSLENPTVIIRVGEDAHKAHKIANLFNVIIERTNKLNK